MSSSYFDVFPQPKRAANIFNLFVRDYIHKLQKEKLARQAQHEADIRAGKVTGQACPP